MKKLLALLLSVMMMGSVLTACGKDDDNKNKKKDNSKDSSDSVIAKDLEFTLGTDVATPAKETVGKEVDINEEELKKALTFDMSKEFTMSYNMITAEAEYPIVLTTNGKDMYIKMNMFGTEMIILVLDGKAYGISDANKVYSVEDVGDEATEDYFSGIDISEELAEYSELVTKAEEVTIDGNKLTRYTVDSDNTYLYVADGKLLAMANVTEGIINMMVIDEMSQTANKDYLVVPEGYEEVTSDELNELLLG